MQVLDITPGPGYLAGSAVSVALAETRDAERPVIVNLPR